MTSSRRRLERQFGSESHVDEIKREARPRSEQSLKSDYYAPKILSDCHVDVRQHRVLMLSLPSRGFHGFAIWPVLSYHGLFTLVTEKHPGTYCEHGPYYLASPRRPEGPGHCSSCRTVSVLLTHKNFIEIPLRSGSTDKIGRTSFTESLESELHHFNAFTQMPAE